MIFSASRGIFSASRGDLVRISLNFSTFNILSLPRFPWKKTAPKSLFNAYTILKLRCGFLNHLFQSYKQLSVPSTSPPFCLFDVIFHTIIYHGFRMIFIFWFLTFFLTFSIFQFRINKLYHGFRKRAWHAPTYDIRPTSVEIVTHSRRALDTRLHLTQDRQVSFPNAL